MFYFLVNPTASSGKGSHTWKTLEHRLNSSSIDFQAFHLKKPGEATALAQKITQEDPYAVLVAVGGDGTINETINGIRNLDTVTFACIPSGSGNDFCRGLRLTTSPSEALDHILHPAHIARINVGIITDGKQERRFAVSAGIGFDAQVCYQASRSRLKPFLNRLGLGSLVYTAVAVKSLLGMHQPHLRIRLDQDQILDLPGSYFAAFMNLPYEGGGYQFVPWADPSDNRIDLFTAHGLSRLRVLVSLPLAMKGKHTGIPGIRIDTSSLIQVQSSDPLCVHCDGEHFGFADKVMVQTCPDKLSVIVG